MVMELISATSCKKEVFHLYEANDHFLFCTFFSYEPLLLVSEQHVERGE